VGFGFGLTEPNHGSDATHMFTHAVKKTKDGVDGWEINGGKMWISGMHRATHCLVFARTHGKAGDALGITAFFVPKGTPGFEIESYEWTFNMPTDHASMYYYPKRRRKSADNAIKPSHSQTSSCPTPPS
jgi:alkylation response protein AidB-like acyl-CoA dehydrogenase